MGIGVTVGGIRWEYLKTLDGRGSLVLVGWSPFNIPPASANLDDHVEGINRELRAEQLRSFHPRGKRIIPTSPLRVTIEQVREAMSEFPKLLRQKND